MDLNQREALTQRCSELGNRFEREVLPCRCETHHGLCHLSLVRSHIHALRALFETRGHDRNEVPIVPLVSLQTWSPGRTPRHPIRRLEVLA